MRTCDIKMAVRAYNKALQHSEQLRAQEEGAACDHLFDGGEWSDGWHADAYQRAIDGIRARVAARFEIDPEELDRWWQQFGNEQHDRMMDAMFPNLRPEAPRFIDGDE